MKIRDEGVHRAHLLRRTNEDTRRPIARGDAVIRHRTLERSHGGRAHRPHPMARGARLAPCRCRICGKHVALLVHHVSGGVVGLDRLECPRPHVQHHLAAPHSARFDLVQERGREMQPSRWRRHRSSFARKHRLIAVRVGGVVATSNVRWQGDVPVCLDRDVDTHCRAKLHDACAPLRDAHDLSGESCRDLHHAARFELPSRRHHGFVLSVAQRSEQKNLGRRTRANACATEPGLYHFRAIHHEQVTSRHQ